MQNKKWHLIYSQKPRRDANRPATNHLLANLWQIYANYVSRCPRAMFPSANSGGPKGRQEEREPARQTQDTHNMQTEAQGMQAGRQATRILPADAKIVAYLFATRFVYAV